jgi:hypothetical protein
VAVLFLYHANVSPAIPIPVEGTIIKENDHGYIFCIDQAQDDLLWHLILIAVIALPVGGALSKTGGGGACTASVLLTSQPEGRD